MLIYQRVGLHIATYGSNKLGHWIRGAAIPVTVTAIVITAIDPIVSWPILAVPMSPIRMTLVVIPTSSNRPGWQRPKVTHYIITEKATRKGHKLFKNSTEFEAFKIFVYIYKFLWVLCVYIYYYILYIIYHIFIYYILHIIYYILYIMYYILYII